LCYLKNWEAFKVWRHCGSDTRLITRARHSAGIGQSDPLTSSRGGDQSRGAFLVAATNKYVPVDPVHKRKKARIHYFMIFVQGFVARNLKLILNFIN
jgi:hypothetical protein